jgi:hypothetical protein
VWKRPPRAGASDENQNPRRGLGPTRGGLNKRDAATWRFDNVASNERGLIEARCDGSSKLQLLWKKTSPLLRSSKAPNGAEVSVEREKPATIWCVHVSCWNPAPRWPKRGMPRPGNCYQ